MNPRYFSRESAIVPIVAAVSLVGKEGFFYKLDSANKAVIVAAVTDDAAGIILDVLKGGLEITALPIGASGGVVKAKLGTAITDLRKDLALKADGTVESDPGTGGATLVARPLEVGAADELIDCVLLNRRKCQVADSLTALTFSATVTAAEADALRDAILLALQTHKLMA